ncbi:MAG TPA: nucleoside hydrolase [Anaerolineae bacterium]|jgi:purine nucleosidase|nr:nucleoside hydrolase [Anaerolineae bacterium]
MERVIIDTDPGVDDAHALMMALAHPGVRVEAITTVAGNVGLSRTTANACTVLDVLGQDVPVYAGCDRPLISRYENAAYVHGRDGLGDAGFPPSTRPVEAEHAAAALIRLASEAPGEISLVAIGPLTNLAVALKLDPQLPGKFKQLIVMGGAIYAQGNTPNLTAEYNVYTDPEAAHIVFEAWPRFSLVSWETTLAHGFPLSLVKRWMAWDTPRARFYRTISAKTLAFTTEVMKRDSFFGPDGLAVALLLDPTIVQAAEVHHVTVELGGAHARGQTIVDWTDGGNRPANARIILQVDQDKFNDLMALALR